MLETTYYKLKKPEAEDYADITVINGNSDVLDDTLHALDMKIIDIKIATLEQIDEIFY